VPKKPRPVAKNFWLRQREKFPADPSLNEPPLADFYRHHVPSFLFIAGWVQELGLARDAKINGHEIAKAVYFMALAYRQGQGIQSRIEEYSELKRKGQLPSWAVATLKTRNRGRPSRYADSVLIVAASRLLQRIKGHNAQIGWGHWKEFAGSRRKKISEARGTRRKSEMQLFVELILALIDPQRSDLPPASYYPQVKKRLGLAMPRS
jgi:hypothetical protein